jgi:hypothetical protein
MIKTIRNKIENWILDRLKQEGSHSYYSLLRQFPNNWKPNDLHLCLESLSATGKIIKQRDTPNPNYETPNG